jgi:small nuclear ribonucleoprotein (snRNP)-like protein
MSNYSLIYTHLRNVSILVTKRLEILNYLHVLDNENYDFVDNNRQYFDRLSAQAKKLRVEVKSFNYSKRVIWTPLVGESVENFLDEVDHHVNIILNDIVEVKNKMARTVNSMRNMLKAEKLNEIILIDTQPISALISELNELSKNYKQVRGLIQDLVNK